MGEVLEINPKTAPGGQKEKGKMKHSDIDKLTKINEQASKSVVDDAKTGPAPEPITIRRVTEISGFGGTAANPKKRGGKK